MQCRSGPYLMAAKKYLDEGKLGKVHFVRVFDQKGGAEALGNFPRRAGPRSAKRFLTGRCGTAQPPEARYNTNYVNHWHSFWRYSGGDMVNDAVHQLDVARWLMGAEYPKSVSCMGGRLSDEGVAEAPDVQLANFELEKLLLTVEMTLYTPYMLKVSPSLRRSMTDFPYWPQCATRIEIYGTNGLMYVGRHGGGWQVYIRPKSEKPVLKDQTKGPMPRPGAQGELHPVHPQPRVAECRRGGRAPQRPVDPLRQHQPSAGR